MKRRTIHYENKPIYDIVIDDSFRHLQKELQKLGLEERRVCIVSESQVAEYYLQEIVRIFQETARYVTVFVFPAGEKNKNLNTVQNLYEHLILEKFDRKDFLVALGGGVTGDLTGYAAATYLRGIQFIQIPTSLLAQVDSSIGGKTGVDFNAYKNMIGAFHQPRLVYINITTLKTLNEREFLSGMGEIVKHGLIKDAGYYQWLKERRDKIVQMDSETLMSMIETSCDIKGNVVEQDPKEQGERALLNLGHTLGHSIEKLMNFQFLHGECVMLGTKYAAYISHLHGNISQEDYQDIKEVLKSFGMPQGPLPLEGDEIIKATKLDKKMDAGAIRFVLLKKIGEACIDCTVSDEDMKRGLMEQ